MRLKLVLILLIILVLCPVCISDNMQNGNKFANFTNQSVEGLNNNSLDILPTIMNNIDILFLAITAVATLSGALLQIKQRRENRPIIDVQHADDLESGPSGILKLYIYASNNGQSAVTLSSIGIEIPEFNKYSLSNKYLFLDTGKYNLPFNLKPGARPLTGGYGQYINITEVSETLKSKGQSEDVKAFFFLKDGPGRTYRCEKPFIFPLTIEDIESHNSVYDRGPDWPF